MPDTTVKFVALVEKYPSLWNYTLHDYSRIDIVEKAWLTIARQMRWSVAICKERWQNIRNGMVRSLKRLQMGSKKPYYLSEKLQFLLPYIRLPQRSDATDNISLSDIDIKSELDENESESTQNLFEENMEDDYTGATAEPSKRNRETHSDMESPKKKKRRIEENDYVDRAVLEYIKESRDNKKPNDDRQMFLSSLLPDVTNLSERNLRRFKIKTLVLLDQLLTQQDQPTKHHDDSQRINNDHTYCNSGITQRCPRASSINNTVNTLVPSPIPVKSSPSSISYTTITHGDSFENKPFFITKITDAFDY